MNDYIDELVNTGKYLDLAIVAKGLEADGRAAREALAETKAELEELRSAARELLDARMDALDAAVVTPHHDDAIAAEAAAATRVRALLGVEDTDTKDAT